jgi:arylsulfatase A-like enzyme
LWLNGQKQPLNNNNGHQNEYSHDLFTKEAINYIQLNKDNPFFLYLAYTIPHLKWQVPDLEQYENKDWPMNMKIQAAMISRMSKDVGRISRLLEELDLEKNTLIIFSSDNGTHGKGETLQFFKSSGNLKGKKRDMYDGGVRSPTFAYWPGTIKEGKVSDHISAFWDILPTLSELTGEPINGKTDGISMLPTLLGAFKKQEQHSHLYWELYESKPNCAIRYGNWKAVVNDRRKGLNIELYDVKEDQGEQNNVANKYPEILKEIRDLMVLSHVKNEFWDIEYSPLFNAEAACKYNGVKPDVSYPWYKPQQKKIVNDK